MDLDRGAYVVYERTGGTTEFGPVSFTRLHGVSIDERQLTIVGEDGEPVAVRNASPNETLDRGSDHFVSAVRFDVPRAGPYVLRFRTRPGEVVVEHPMGEVLGQRVPWIAAVIVGWLTALAGMIMLLTGVIRRGRAQRAARLAVATSAVAAAGWFPDPMGQYRLRYWDGAQWTDYTSG